MEREGIRVLYQDTGPDVMIFGLVYPEALLEGRLLAIGKFRRDTEILIVGGSLRNMLL